jgi:hypothetical protein
VKASPTPTLPTEDAGGGTRTLKARRPRHFECRAFASFATPASGHGGYTVSGGWMGRRVSGWTLSGHSSTPASADLRLDQGHADARPRPPPAPRGDAHGSPARVLPLRLSGAVLDERTVRAIVAFVVIYIGVFAVGALAILLEGVRTT